MRNYFILAIMLYTFTSIAQNDSAMFQTKISTDFVSRYIWRGIDYFNSPAIQPDIELMFKEKVGIGAWGSFSFTNQPIHETDLFLFFQSKHFTIYLYDYFYMNQLINNHYFDYSQKSTGHTFSLDLSYTVSESIPLTILASYNFYGNDTLHSNYAELSYKFKEKPIEIFMGGTFSKGWYANTAGIVNTGIKINKKIEINDHLNIPTYVSLIFNPTAQNIYIVASFTL